MEEPAALMGHPSCVATWKEDTRNHRINNMSSQTATAHKHH